MSRHLLAVCVFIGAAGATGVAGCATTLALPDGTELSCPSDATLVGGHPDDDGALCVDDQGRRHGPFATWTPDLSPVARGHWHHGRRDRRWQVFHADGTVAASLAFDRGVPSGDWTSTTPDGEVSFTGHYVDGVPHGEVAVLDPAREVHLVAVTERGRLHGPVDLSLGDGSRLEAHFADGLAHGPWRLFHTGGVAPFVTMGFVLGRPDGEVEVRDEDGALLLEGAFAAGLRSGTWRYRVAPGHTIEGSYDDQGRRTGTWVRVEGDAVVARSRYEADLLVSGRGETAPVWIQDVREPAAEQMVEMLDRIEGLELDAPALAASLCALGATSACRDVYRALEADPTGPGRQTLLDVGVLEIYDDAERADPGRLQLACDDSQIDACAALPDPDAERFDVFCNRNPDGCVELGTRLGGDLERALATRACELAADAGCRWLRDHPLASVWGASDAPTAEDTLRALCESTGEAALVACFHLARELDALDRTDEALARFDALCDLDSGAACHNAGAVRWSARRELPAAAERFARSCQHGDETDGGCEAAAIVLAELRAEDAVAALGVLETTCDGGRPAACAALERQTHLHTPAQTAHARARLVAACRESTWSPVCTGEILDAAYPDAANPDTDQDDASDAVALPGRPPPPVWGLADEQDALELVLAVYAELGVTGLESVELVLDDQVLVPFYSQMAGRVYAPRFLSTGADGMRAHLATFSRRTALGAFALRTTLGDEAAREAWAAFMVVALAHELGHHLQQVAGEGGLAPLELELGAIDHELDWLLQAVLGGHLPARFVASYLAFNAELLDALDGHDLDLEAAVASFDVTYRHFQRGLALATRLGTTPWPLAAAATMVVYTRARQLGAAERALATCEGTRCRSTR